jgi:hypothetical protein
MWNYNEQEVDWLADGCLVVTDKRHQPLLHLFDFLFNCWICLFFTQSTQRAPRVFRWYDIIPFDDALLAFSAFFA